MKTWLIFLVMFGCASVSAYGWWPFPKPIDPLAQRDEWGPLHQTRDLDSTDFEPRIVFRWPYYFADGRYLARHPAYVGALQNALRRRGLYCGPVDGVFSEAVSDAISRLQKNASQRVTGTITVGVRRELHLP